MQVEFSSAFEMEGDCDGAVVVKRDGDRQVVMFLVDKRNVQIKSIKPNRNFLILPVLIGFCRITTFLEVNESYGDKNHYEDRTNYHPDDQA